MPLPRQPTVPTVSFLVREGQVEHERPARREMLITASQRLRTAGYPEGVADVDRLIGTRQIELIARLRVHAQLEALARRLFATEREHVRGYVTAVYIQSGPQQGQEQAARSTREIESRWSVA